MTGVVAAMVVAHVPTLGRKEITPDFQQTLVQGERVLGDAVRRALQPNLWVLVSAHWVATFDWLPPAPPAPPRRRGAAGGAVCPPPPLAPGAGVAVVGLPSVLMADHAECLRAGAAVHATAKRLGRRVVFIASTAFAHAL